MTDTSHHVPVKEGGCIINTCTYMHTHNLRVVWRDDRRSTVSSSYIVSAMENHAYSMGWVSWQHKGLHGHSIVPPACSRSTSVTVCVVWLWGYIQKLHASLYCIIISVIIIALIKDIQKLERLQRRAPPN